MRLLPAVLLLCSQFLLAQQPTPPAANLTHGVQSPSGTSCAQMASVAQAQEMLDVGGYKKMLDSAMDIMGPQMLETYKKMQPDIPPQVWNAALAQVRSPQVLQALLDELVPIYQRHFCSDEIEQIIAFYGTPGGKKLIAEMPAIQRESADATNAYFRRMNEQLKQNILEELRKQGIKPDTPPKASDNSQPKQ